jgi:protein-L-isoaspartate(D-aspartate) O-methyltransferase
VADAAELHRALIDGLVGRRGLTDARVEAAFRAVPRHLFLPGVPLAEVYRDQFIVTKTVDGEAVSSSSQPEIMATMLEQLDVAPGHRVLEIGAGTGYNAALLARLVGETGEVVTVDIDDDIVAAARAHLAAAGVERVRVVGADGGFGYAEAAPYDRIIVTVGAWDIAPAWREQLGPGGRLVLPLALGGAQKSAAFGPADGHLVSVSLEECLFMPLRGAFAGPPSRVRLGSAPELTLWVRDPASVDPAAANGLVRGGARDHATGIRVTGREVYGGLILWLAVRETSFGWLESTGPGADAAPVPPLFGQAGTFRSTAGLFEATGACVLMRPAEPPPRGDGDEPFELLLRGLGDAGPLAGRLLRHVRAWDAAGRPATAGMTVRAYPVDAPYAAGLDDVVIVKRWHRFVLSWPRSRPV